MSAGAGVGRRGGCWAGRRRRGRDRRGPGCVLRPAAAAALRGSTLHGLCYVLEGGATPEPSLSAAPASLPLQAWDAEGTALLVNERLINCPPSLAPPLLQGLLDEVAWATEDEPTAERRDAFRVRRYLLITRVYADPEAQHGAAAGGSAGGGAGKKKQKTVRAGARGWGGEEGGGDTCGCSADGLPRRAAGGSPPPARRRSRARTATVARPPPPKLTPPPPLWPLAPAPGGPRDCVCAAGG